MNDALVDTSVWLAYFNRRDSLHGRAAQLIDSTQLRLVTTWPIIWETITSLSRNANSDLAAEVGLILIEEKLASIVELTTVDQSLGIALIRRFGFLRLSAADATACALIRRMGIQTAISFDHDFVVVLSDRTVLGANE